MRAGLGAGLYECGGVAMTCLLVGLLVGFSNFVHSQYRTEIMSISDASNEVCLHGAGYLKRCSLSCLAS